jgi:hypothetical protein
VKVQWSILLAGVFATGCGSSGAGGGGDGGDDDVLVDAPAVDGSAPNDAPIDAVDLPDPLPTCVLTCTDATQCGSGPPGGQYDDENQVCDDGVCRWTGCSSDDQCEVYYGDPDMVCEQAFGWSLPQCFETCTVDGDCPHRPGGAVTDGDNFVCDDGKCRWLGCLSTAECDLDTPGRICAVRDTNLEPLCWPICEDVTDCGFGPSDHDNYVCDRGACVWQGCTSTSECPPDRVCTTP